MRSKVDSAKQTPSPNFPGSKLQNNIGTDKDQSVIFSKLSNTVLPQFEHELLRQDIEASSIMLRQAPAIRGLSVHEGDTGEGLAVSAEELEREQRSLLLSAPVEQTYQESLTFYVQAKLDQVERIENRLERLVDQQQARLQQMQANTPRMLSMPSTKRAWQSASARQQARLQRMLSRLELVREIRDGMGVYAPKIEEVATRKMRAENPDLASDWDAMREAARRHQAHMRKREKEREPKRTQGYTRALSHVSGT